MRGEYWRSKFQLESNFFYLLKIVIKLKRWKNNKFVIVRGCVIWGQTFDLNLSFLSWWQWCSFLQNLQSQCQQVFCHVIMPEQTISASWLVQLMTSPARPYIMGLYKWICLAIDYVDLGIFIQLIRPNCLDRNNWYNL